MTLPLPLEDIEQQQVVQYLELKGYKFTAIPNSTYTTSWKQKAHNRRVGLRAGFPDLVCIVNGQFIAIEMKRRQGGRVSKSQREWINALNDAGVPAKVCKGFDQAKEFIDAWANGGPIENYACPSWYDEGGRLIDCICNKCPKKEEVF